MRARGHGENLIGGLVLAASVTLLVAIGGQRRYVVEELLSGNEEPPSAFRSVLVPNATAPPEVDQWNLPRIFGDINAAMASFKPGSRVFVVPEEMRVGNTERVVVRVALKGDDRAILERLPPGVRVELKEVKVTPTMKARLTGEGFDIKAASSEEQILGGGEYTQWDWQVTPQISGDRELLLHVTAVVSIAGFEKPRDIVVETKRVMVRVNPKLWIINFIEANSGNAVSFVFGGAFVWFSGWLGGKIKAHRSKGRRAGFGS